MKKVITILSLMMGGVLAYGQGTIVVNSTAAAYNIFTNSGISKYANGTQTGGTSGKTPTAALGYYYQLLIQPYTGTLAGSATNVIGGGWSAPTYTINNITLLAGGIGGQGGTSGAAVAGWGAPTGSTPQDGGTEDYYLLVGWSANLGTTWALVSSELATESWTTTGFFGVSSIGYGYSGGGPNNVNAPSVFGVTGAEPGGLTSGFTLYTVTPTPEPTTMALAGLGGLAMLMFRRRK
jgi:hypothetical protein